MNSAISRSSSGMRGTRRAGERSCDTTLIGSKFVIAGLEESSEHVIDAFEGYPECTGGLDAVAGVRAMLKTCSMFSVMVRGSGG